MIIILRRNPKRFKVSDSGRISNISSIESIESIQRYNRFRHYDIENGVIDDSKTEERRILEDWLEEQVKLFIHSGKEVPQKLEEELAKEKLRSLKKKTKNFKLEDYDYYGLLNEK